jgi:hypothetical protein
MRAHAQPIPREFLCPQLGRLTSIARNVHGPMKVMVRLTFGVPHTRHGSIIITKFGIYHVGRPLVVGFY